MTAATLSCKYLNLTHRVGVVHSLFEWHFMHKKSASKFFCSPSISMKKCGQLEIYLTKLLTEILLNVTENTQGICSLCEYECISTGDNRENS